MPPLLATAAKEALKIIDDEPERVQRLTQISQKFQKSLVKALEGTGCGIFNQPNNKMNFSFYVQADELSPMKFVHYKDEAKADQKLNDFKDQVARFLF